MARIPPQSGSGSETRPGQRVIRIVLVDDHPVVRVGLRQLIDDQPDMCVCGEAGTPAEVLDLLGTVSPDLALIDLSLGESSGLELVKQLAATHPAIGILVLSMHDERVFAERALQAGARGYIMKQKPGRDLLKAVRRVAAGRIYLSAEMTDRLLEAATGRRHSAEGLSPVERLTDRERDIFGLIAEGYTTRQIADGLRVSTKTVETHRAHIKEKLGLKTATELIRVATTWSGRT